MNPKWLDLAASMLELASSHFNRHGCNGWHPPEGWTGRRRDEFAAAVAEWNGDRVLYGEEPPPTPDWLVMAFLAAQLREPAQCSPPPS